MTTTDILTAALQNVSENDVVDVTHIFGHNCHWCDCASCEDKRTRLTVRSTIRERWAAMGRTERIAVWYDELTGSPTVRIWTMQDRVA